MSSHSRHPHFVYPTPPSTASTVGSSGRAADNASYRSTPPLIPDLSSTSSTSNVRSSNFQPYISASPVGRAVIPLLPGSPYDPDVCPSKAFITSNAPGSGLFAVTSDHNGSQAVKLRSKRYKPSAIQSSQPIIPCRLLLPIHKSSSCPRKPRNIRTSPCQLLHNTFASNSIGNHHTLNPPALHNELLRKARFNSTDGAATRFACLRWDMRFPPSHSFGRDRCRYYILHYHRGQAPLLTLSNAFIVQPLTQLLRLKSSDNTVQPLLNLERDAVLTVQELLKKLFEYLNTSLPVHPADDLHLKRTCARRVNNVESLPKNLGETYRLDSLGVNHGFYGFELKYGKTQAELVLSVPKL
ncbi:hypothetical protein CPB85DRAFT_1331670 [Mucidula mucida]|nr:hypothetical protein CPB85DRAFT_1331670 [Mucidula mucida]